MKSFYLTDAGKVRDHNEDSVIIVKNKNIDMLEHFSWHSNLKYTYPHWLYDVGTYLVYQLGENIGIGGFTAIYILTVLLSITLGLVIYMACVKIVNIT